MVGRVGRRPCLAGACVCPWSGIGWEIGGMRHIDVLGLLPFGAVGHLAAGRGQIGTSLSFHLFFAVLGVGLPLMMLVAEGMHLRTGDPVWRALARRWSEGLGGLLGGG